MKQRENIKNSIFYKALMGEQISKLKNVISPALRSLGIGGIFAFLFLNLVFSQFISLDYFKLINNDKRSVISFLEKIKDFPEFEKVLEMNKNIYGMIIEDEVFRQENEKKLLINNLEQQLAINPKARDVLYSLYQLYLAKGDKDKAEEYLSRAKEIDPTIK